LRAERSEFGACLGATYSVHEDRPDGAGFITRFSRTGRELSTFAVGSRYSSTSVRLVPRTGGGYYLLTLGRTQSSGEIRPMIARLDPALGVVWTVAMYRPFGYSYGSWAPAADGGLWVMMQSDEIFRLSDDGTIAWQGEIDAERASLRSLGVLPSGDVVMGGEGTLLRMTPEGTIVWALEHPHLIDDVDVGESGHIAVLSRSWGGDSGPPYHVVTLNEDGVPLWTRNFVLDGLPLNIWDVDVDSTGRVTVSGNFRDEPEQSHPWIARFSAAGDPEWELALPDPGDHTAITEIRSAGNDLLVVGRTGVPGRFDWGAWTMLIDESGDPGSPCRAWENWNTPTTTDPVTLTDHSAGVQEGFLEAWANEISIDPLPLIHLPMGGDAFEEDDSCGEGVEWSPSSGGRTQARDFCDDPDDWLRLSAQAGETYTIETTPIDPGVDSVVEVLDAACGAVLWSDDDGGVAGGSRLEFTPASHEDYRIRIRSKAGSSGAGHVYRLALAGEPRQGAPWSRSGLQTRGLASSRVGHIVTTDGERFALLDESGTAIWTKGLQDVRLARVAAASDCSFALTGSQRGFGFWLGAMASDGHPLWQLRSEEDRDAVAIGLSVTPEGHWLVGAEQGGAPMIAEVDADGSPLWQARPDLPLSYDLTFTATLADGTRVLQSDERVFGFDATGSHQWTFELPTLHAAGIVPLSDGSLVALGSTATWAESGGVSAAFRLRPPDGIDWSRRYASGFEVFFASGRALPGGEVVVVGRHRETADGASRPLLLTLDPATGDPTLIKGIDGNEPIGTFLDVAVGPEGHVLAGGEAPLMLTDALANVGTACSPPLDLPLTVDAWPGPAAYGGAPDLLPEVALVPVEHALRPDDVGTTLLCHRESLPPLEVSPPGSPQPLRVERSVEVSWEDAGVNGAERFHLYRFDLEGTGLGGDCSLPACTPLVLDTNVHVDPESPGLDRGWAYLVAGTVAGEEGPLGRDSFGRLRPVPLTCP